MPQNNVIYLDSTRQGAPVICGQVNTLNQALYQLLCTGFNSQTLTSLTRSGNVATATLTGHGFKTYDWVKIAGANEAYNGMQQVTNYDTNTFTFAVSGAPATPATGTITVCFAPLGWSRIYNSGNKSVYQGDDQSSLLPLYVDDSGTIGSQSYRGAWFCGYESWSGGVGTNPWPTVAQQSTGLYWNKSNALDGTARPWWIRGNGKRLLMGIRWNSSSFNSAMASVFGFGDYLPTIPGNAFPGFIIGSTADTQSYPLNTNSFQKLVSLGAANTTDGKFLCRKYDGTGSAIGMGMAGNNSVSTNLGNGGLPGSNPATSGYEITPIDLHAGYSLATASYYSPLPGAYQLLHDQLFNDQDFLPEDPDLPGRRLIVLVIIGSNVSNTGRLVLDITGPD